MPLINMDRLGNIEAFLAAAELGSLTRAARRLAISPSALSRRIGQLEHEIGVRLLHRTTRALRLTDEGRAYFERSRSAVRELAEAQEAAARSRDEPIGHLAIEAPTILGRTIVVPAVARFARRFPGVQVQLALRDHPADLMSEGIDVAVRMGPLADSTLVARKLGTTWMRAYAARAYLKRKGTPRTVEALNRHARIELVMHGRPILWRLCERDVVREVPHAGRMLVNTGDALIDLCAAGLGVAWMCDFMGQSRARELVEILPQTACESLPIHALALPTRQTLPKVRHLVDLVAAELAGIAHASPPS